MARPLLITDCDEVLLHMVVPFGEWLDEAHDIHFDIDQLFHPETGGYRNAMTHRSSGEAVAPEAIFPFLKSFFTTEMHRQSPITGAIQAISTLGQTADIVVLTNLTDDARDRRAAQLRAIGIDCPVYTNQGGKGEPLVRIVADYAPSVAVFVDDLVHQHGSVAAAAPDVFRLHMVGEPRIAGAAPSASDAHDRIDDWAKATTWIQDRFAGIPL